MVCLTEQRRCALNEPGTTLPPEPAHRRHQHAPAPPDEVPSPVGTLECQRRSVSCGFTCAGGAMRPQAPAGEVSALDTSDGSVA